MYIADPFGSFVQGAREGQQDAINLRNAQDQTMRNAYGLNRQAAFDQYALNQAQRENQLGQQVQDSGIPLQLLQERSRAAQLGNDTAEANMGFPQASIQHIASRNPNASLVPNPNDPNGAPDIKLPVPVGQDTLNYSTNAALVRTPQQIAAQNALANHQAQLRIAQGRLDSQEAQRLWQRLYGTHAPVAPSDMSVLGGLSNGTTNTTTPNMSTVPKQTGYSYPGSLDFLNNYPYGGTYGR